MVTFEYAKIQKFFRNIPSDPVQGPENKTHYIVLNYEANAKSVFGTIKAIGALKIAKQTHI